MCLSTCKNLAHGRGSVQNAGPTGGSWVPLRSAPANDWSVSLPASHRAPELGQRGVLGSLRSPAHLWLPLHPPAGTTLSGRSALPGTPWLLTLRVRSPGGSLWPALASPPLAPFLSPPTGLPHPWLSPDSETLPLGSFTAHAQGKPCPPSLEGPLAVSCTLTSVPWAPFCPLLGLCPPRAERGCQWWDLGPGASVCSIAEVWRSLLPIGLALYPWGPLSLGPSATLS